MALKTQYKILLGQLGRRGDCLYATAIARQIKQDYPGCHLTWAISSLYRSIIDGNPFIDEIWEIKQNGLQNFTEAWNQFHSEAMTRKDRGQYNEVFFTQVSPANFQNFDGTCRSSLFRGYPHQMTVPIQPVIRLSNREILNVKNFVAKNRIAPEDTVVLFECASTSGQSYVTPEFALQTAQTVVQRNNRIKFILTSDKSISQQNLNIIDGSVLPFRENAELTRYCSLIVGCSSGISWLATSDWAKPIPQIQLLKKQTRMFASMLNDAKYYHLPTDRILETVDATIEEVSNIILCSIENGFDIARERFQRDIPIKFDFYLTQLDHELLSKQMYLKTAQAIGTALERFQNDEAGIKELRKTIKTILTPYLRIYWNRMNKEERLALNKIGIEADTHSYVWIRCTAFFSLFWHSFFGNMTKTARHLLLRTLRNSR